MLFRSDGERVLYTLYNDTDEDVWEALLPHAYPELRAAADCWNGKPVEVVEQEDGRVIACGVPARDITVIRVIRA